MLILVRKVQQGIWIEGDIWVKVLSIERDGVKLGITAPDDVKVIRQELVAELEIPEDLANPGKPKDHLGGMSQGPEAPRGRNL